MPDFKELIPADSVEYNVLYNDPPNLVDIIKERPELQLIAVNSNHELINYIDKPCKAAMMLTAKDFPIFGNIDC